MVALTQQEKQVVDLFRRLEPGRRRYVLLEMAKSDRDAWKRFQPLGEARLRELAKKDGLDWDTLEDKQKQDFVERLADGDEA
jgi:hypothetical protein